jgi:sterol desaturase/sphingolipid hydroxylase (fatty acid hydroxylase superfamily)
MLLVFLQHVIVGVATYYSTSFVQMLFHRIFGHTRRIAKIHDVHVGGHHAQYVPQLLSDRWIRTERHITWYYAIPFTPMVLTAFWLLPLSLFVVHTLSLAFSVWWHVYLHRQYHVRGVWFERFAWFREKRRLHFVHHQHPRRNYAIVEYGWDRLLGTFDVDHDNAVQPVGCTEPGGSASGQCRKPLAPGR